MKDTQDMSPDMLRSTIVDCARELELLGESDGIDYPQYIQDMRDNAVKQTEYIRFMEDKLHGLAEVLLGH
jgi:hypothetical protein